MKYNILLNIFKILDISQTIIFCNDEKTVSDLNKNLSDLNYICNLLNEDRTKNISNFKKGQIRIMITTFDINLEEINLYNNAMIINYQMPGDINSYMKYFGRNEFFGKEGIIINFVTNSDKDTITSLEKVIENSIQELPNEFSDNI